ncbi:unnamed protein product, partial [Didymodactylos carnosus]
VMKSIENQLIDSSPTSVYSSLIKIGKENSLQTKSINPDLWKPITTSGNPSPKEDMQLLMKTPAQLLTSVKAHEASCEEGDLTKNLPKLAVSSKRSTSTISAPVEKEKKNHIDIKSSITFASNEEDKVKTTAVTIPKIRSNIPPQTSPSLATSTNHLQQVKFNYHSNTVPERIRTIVLPTLPSSLLAPSIPIKRPNFNNLLPIIPRPQLLSTIIGPLVQATHQQPHGKMTSTQIPIQTKSKLQITNLPKAGIPVRTSKNLSRKRTHADESLEFESSPKKSKSSTTFDTLPEANRSSKRTTGILYESAPIVRSRDETRLSLSLTEWEEGLNLSTLDNRLQRSGLDNKTEVRVFMFGYAMSTFFLAVPTYNFEQLMNDLHDVSEEKLPAAINLNDDQRLKFLFTLSCPLLGLVRPSAGL